MATPARIFSEIEAQTGGSAVSKRSPRGWYAVNSEAARWLHARFHAAKWVVGLRSRDTEMRMEADIFGGRGENVNIKP